MRMPRPASASRRLGVAFLPQDTYTIFLAKSIAYSIYLQVLLSYPRSATSKPETRTLHHGNELLVRCVILNAIVVEYYWISTIGRLSFRGERIFMRS